MPEDFHYYPALSDLIDIDVLPESFNFIKEGIENVLDNIYYKDYTCSYSTEGNNAFYSLVIISRKRLAFEIFGSGISFILNSDYINSSISSFPITLFWEWEILKYFRNFKLNNFSFTPEAFFDVGIKIFSINKVQALKYAVSTFVIIDDLYASKFIQLISDINFLYNSNIIIDESDEDKFEQLIIQVESLDKDVFTTIFSLYLFGNSLQETKQKLDYFFSIFIPTDLETYVKDLFIPKVRASLTLRAAIEFPRSILIPMQQTPDGLVPDETLDAGGNLKKSYFQFVEADFEFDTEAGIGSNVFLEGSLLPAEPVVHEIGNTGLTISFTNAKLDLSTNTNIPEADAAGYPVDFKGVYLEQATIGFNRFGSADTGHTSANIFARNLLIGTGGLTGTIALESNGALYRKFGGFAVQLDYFSMDFRQGSIVSSEISGELTLPIFKNGNAPAKLAINAYIYDDGNFKVTAQPLAEPLKITLPNVLELRLRSVEMGRTDRGHYLEVAGLLDFIGDIPGLGRVLPADIEIDSLRIWDNGDLEFKSGVLRIKRSFKLKVGPVNLEVSDVHIGAYRDKARDRGYHYFGFDGMVNGGRSGFQTTGNGIKYYFSTDGKAFDHFIRIDGIDIDLALPNREKPAFLLHGHLSMSNPDPNIVGSNADSEYTGSVSFSVPKLDLSGSAGMRMKPSVPSFLVDVGMELANPTPLGGTGLGIYGFRGLIGQHYMPHKADGASWWDYYKAKSSVTGREGVEIDKFTSKPGFSFGAGLSIATSFDSGRFFSSKLFMLLGLPDVFLVQGQAAILRERIGLRDDVDPPFSALIVIGDNSVRGNLAVDYYLPEKGGFRGGIFELHGQLDMAFFFNNASGWYINVGKDSPETERVRARVLTLFNMHAYLMLSMQGVKAGAGARFDFKKRFLGISVGFGAYLNLGGFISFKPAQIGGYIALGAYVYIKIFRFKLGFDVNAMLAVEAPHPFNIIGSFQIRINLPWPFKDLKINIDFSWRINNNMAPLLAPIEVLQVPNPLKGYLPGVATHILTGESFGLNYVDSDSLQDIPDPGDTNSWAYPFGTGVTIPLDSFIDIELLKPVKPGNLPLGGAGNQLPTGYVEILPPQKGAAPQVRHEFEIVGLEIKAWNGTAWMPYHVYEAVTAIVNSNTGAGAIDLSELKQGYWQFQEPGRFNKIRLLSQNMFSYSNRITNADRGLNARNFLNTAALCFTDILNELIVNWKEDALDTSYPQGQPVSLRSIGLIFTDINAVVKMGSAPLSTKLLEVSGKQGNIAFNLPKSMGRARLDFGSREVPIRLMFYSRTNRKVGPVRIPIRQLVHTIDLPGGTSAETIFYDNNSIPIDEISVQLDPEPQLDFTGHLLIGVHVALPDSYEIAANVSVGVEKERTLFMIGLFNRSFTATEAISKPYQAATGMIAQWTMYNPIDTVGGRVAIRLGAPNKIGSLWANQGNALALIRPYQFTGNSDGMIIPYANSLKIEDESFSIEATVIFKPEKGLATLLSKLAVGQGNLRKKGYTIHLLQESGTLNDIFPDAAILPQFKLVFSFYNQDTSSSITILDDYAYDCQTNRLSANQYKHILLSVDRGAGVLEIFLDGQSRHSGELPSELSVIDHSDQYVQLKELGFMTPGQNQSLEDNGLSEPKLIEEIKIMENGMHRSIQPVWRPNTTYAVRVVTQDRVNGSTVPKRHIFGFRTAGPIGHFHQQSDKYAALVAQDRADEFKLRSLRDYIDFQRSHPDAQGRMDVSKPVYYHDPQIRLFFVKEYVTAMFANWDGYQSLDPVQSKLSAVLIDNTGAATAQELLWLPDLEQEIDDLNFKSLPPDLRLLYMLNRMASLGACNGLISPMRKKIKRGGYSFADLRPGELYTAVFNAVYKVGNFPEDNAEVHRFNFMTSRFPSFSAHASSFIDGNTMAIKKIQTAFSQQAIQDNLLPLINAGWEDDPLTVRNYQSRFDRLVLGAMKLRNVEALEHNSIQVIMNGDGDGVPRVLGLILRSPEPLNDPKLGDEQLAGTVELTITDGGQLIAGPADFIYLFSQDTSAVFITNAAMDLELATITFKLRYKQFNGVDYETVHEDYQSPEIDVMPYLS